MTETANVFILIAVLIIAVVAVVYLTMTRGSTPALNREKFQRKWLEIENSLVRDQISTYHMAIMNADKLLDEALRDRHTKGESMGERMKNASSAWSNINAIWGAHKVRNNLAHESDYTLSHDTALKALSAYKRALKDLGAI